MFPAIKDGDLVIGFRLPQDYAKNDVVVPPYQRTTLHRTYSCKTGDTVMLDESGKLLINGTAQNGEILYPTYAEEGLEYPLTVPENHMFILGDYTVRRPLTAGTLGRYRWMCGGKVITILRRRGL